MFSFTGNAQGQILEKIIAKVADEDIFYSEVQELYSYAKAQNPEYTEDLKCEILDQLISSKIMLDQAKLDSIYISDEELTGAIDRRMDQILAQMGGDESVFQEYYGITIDEQRENMREPMKEQMIQQRIQDKIIQNVQITPNDVVEFFNQIPSDSLPYLPAEVELAEIAIKTIISDETKTKAREKIDQVRDRIVNDGESFAELASIFSDDPGSAARGGELGWAKRGSYVPEFEAMAFGIEPGEISEVIETDFGYHFMELLERRGNNIKVRHILIKPEITEADIAATKAHIDTIRKELVKDSLSFAVAVKRYGSEDVQSYNNAGRMINPETGDTFWETGQLPYQIYFAIESMEQGDVSEIVEMEERGDKIYKLLKLQTRTKPHKASLDTDFTRIEDIAKQSKKNEYFNDWMEKKIKSTIIKVDDAFTTCDNLSKFLDTNN